MRTARDFWEPVQTVQNTATSVISAYKTNSENTCTSVICHDRIVMKDQNERKGASDKPGRMLLTDSSRQVQRSSQLCRMPDSPAEWQSCYTKYHQSVEYNSSYRQTWHASLIPWLGKWNSKLFISSMVRTATISQPLCWCTCVSQHRQLNTGGF